MNKIIMENKETNICNYELLCNVSLLSVGDYICVGNGFLKCDSPDNKKGFSFKGKIFSPTCIKVFDIKEFEGIKCAVVKKHFNLGCDYYGSEYIIPLSEFENKIQSIYWESCS